MPTDIAGLEVLYAAMLKYGANVIRYHDSEEKLELQLDIWETREIVEVGDINGYRETLNGARIPFIITLYKDEDED